ncbi:single stranded DNA-binding domain-containing protein [Natronorubrum daqingense]|uniref:DNA-binding protein n=1 Tax=Natronorubrum daqingense TaxID=588898 RepID=A0A1N7BT79_9EURY|nr:DNA-binding protein [Natronorubrum daqingense]APX96592.1 DNA-binding protein [Natronorubrum daqingense]SIR54561.1 hypothetical protein SAMN05421809_1348 [Natronorubrum daqingense]
MRLATRIVLTALFLGALLGLCVHYGGTYDDNWPHPSGDQLQDDPDAAVGERVLLFGSVESVEDDTLEIHVTDSEGRVAVELEIDGVDESVASGGTVQVYGVLEDDQTMTPDETVVVEEDDRAFEYKLATSLVGVVLAIAYFCRYWRIDWTTVAFEPRSGGDDRDG